VRIIANLIGEFTELSGEYIKSGPQGADLIKLVTIFGDANDEFDDDTDALYFKAAWERFLEEHKRNVTVEMVGVVIYLLVTYWPQGQKLHESLPMLEKILVWEIMQEGSEEIRRRSEENSDSVLAVPE